MWPSVSERCVAWGVVAEPGTARRAAGRGPECALSRGTGQQSWKPPVPPVAGTHIMVCDVIRSRSESRKTVSESVCCRTGMMADSDSEPVAGTLASA